MESKRGRKLHQDALNAQEQRDFLEALKLEDEATIAYLEGKDRVGLSEIFALRRITWGHLADKYDQFNKESLTVAVGYGEIAVKLAELDPSGKSKAIAYFNLAKSQDALGDYQAAVENFQKAIENQTINPEPNHNRPAILADMKGYLLTTQYKNGDKSVAEKIDETVQELETSEGADDYEKHVWLSGLHMRIAVMLREDDPEKAKDHLQKAREIIDSDPQLSIRKEQWEKLSKEF